ncbi:alpha amylase [Sorangium cellulosum]|uniref:Alpha amylase n=1 Tax=Sorangium cellulosum TaxID=56 RepID=A0A2L0EW37_SORCE|nr:alpha-amylase family glycosyl hydrolase [Sorangium cellulosum]AUX43504.1 alpha amylase [Sorangium cellulosum]
MSRPLPHHSAARALSRAALPCPSPPTASSGAGIDLRSGRAAVRPRRPRPLARRAWVAALLLAASGCESLAPAGPPREAPAAQARLELHADDAEVWAFSARIQGALAGPGSLEDCAVRVGDDVFPAAIEERQFFADVPLLEGDNEISARCRETLSGDLASPPVTYHVRLRDAPRALARSAFAEGKLVLDATGSEPGERSRAEIVGFEWLRLRGALSAPEPLGAGPRLELPAPDAGAPALYELRVRDERGRGDVARVAAPPGDPARANAPTWIDEAVVYGVVPPFFGAPPLDSVRAALPALAELGVNALWLSPLFATPPGDFGYAVTDYFDVRPDYGTAQDLEELVDEAHRLGLRVLLDLVPNHTSAKHPYFQHAEQRKTRSHTFTFYDRDAAGEPTHYFDWEHLPNLNYDSPEVERWMLEVSLHWVRRFGIDGYRVDAAWGIRQRRPELWSTWAAELRRVNPELLLIAEASARDPYYVEHGFDAAYDWTEELGHWAWEGVFDAPRGVAARLGAALAATAASTPRPERALRFINNNDTGARFITRHGPGLTRVAAAALLTLPGIPCIYSFDELGAEFEPYGGLTPVSRPAPGDLARHYEQLIRLRRSTAALRSPGLLTVHAGPDDEVFAYLRYGDDTSRFALVVLNFSGEPVKRTLALPKAFADSARGGLRDGLSGTTARLQADSLALDLEAWDVQVFMPR